MRLSTSLKKILSVIATLATIFNSLGAPVAVIAQAADPSPIPTETPAPTPEETLAPTESPTATPEATPEIASPTPEVIVEPTPAVEETTPAPESQPEVQDQTNENVQSQGPPAEETASPTPTITPIQPEEDGSLSAQILETSLFSETLQENPWFQVITDKLDYAPTEAAVITGTGFIAGETYSLTVSSTDEPATSTTVEVTADSSGSFTYIYQLDGIYRPNYLVEVKEGETLLASTTFTDAQPASGNLQQCRNGDSDSPNDCLELGGSAGWVGGNAGGSNSHYVEGFSIPYRQIMTNLPTGTPITLTMGYDIKHSGANAIDFLTHYDRLESHSPFGHSAENIGPLSGVAGVSATVGTYAIPAPSSAGSPVAGQPTARFNSLPAGERLMTLFGGTISNITYVTQGDLTAAQAETQIAITFTVDSATAVLAWGGHIAREIDWGTNMSAGGISGSPYHMRQTGWFGDTDGDGDNDLPNLGNTDRSLSADAVVPPSSITFVKDASPNNAQDFAFTTTGIGLSNFSLDDDSDSTLLNSITFNNLLEGTYTATETAVPGWSLGSPITCLSDGTGSTYSQITNGVSIDLTAGENITCTFVNTQVTGSITIAKNSIPDDDQDFSFSGDLGAFSLDDDADNTLQNSQTFSSLVGGTYSVVEGAQTGWDLTNITCNDTDGGTTTDLATRTATIDLDHGQNLTCTFENTKQGSISGSKYNDLNGNGVLNDQEPGLQSWTIFIDENANQTLDLGEASTTTGVSGAYSFTNLVPGSYTVCEVEQTDWTKTAPVSCHTVTVNAGLDTPNQDFLNFQCAVISGTKWEDLNGDGVWDEGEPTLEGWIINLNGDEATDTTDENGAYSFKVCSAGSRTISETFPSDDWYQTYPGGASPYHQVEVTSGGTYTDKDFGNARYATIFGYKYRDSEGDGVLDAGDLLDTLEGWVINLYNGLTDALLGTTTTDVNGYYEFTGLLAGSTYYVLEELITGWTQTYGPVPTPTPIAIQSNDQTEIDFANFENVSITVCKVADADGDESTTYDQTPVADWEIDLNKNGQTFDSTRVTGRDGCYEWTNLGPGSYSAEEETRAGWQNLNETTYDFGAVQSGDELTHTFVNTELGNVVVIKYNDHNGNGIKDDGDETLNDWEIWLNDSAAQWTGQGDPAVDGQVTFSDVPPGSYNIHEQLQESDGWYQTNIDCGEEDGIDNDNDNNHPIDLAAGQDLTCYVGNRGLGTIIVEKEVVPDSGATFDFSIVSDLIETIGFTLGDGDSTDPDYSGLPAGTYSVSEDPDDLYSTEVSCVSDQEDTETAEALNLDPGETITCTFTNTRKTGNIQLTKLIDADGDLGTDDDRTPYEGWVMDVDPDGAYTSDPTLNPTDANGETSALGINTGTYWVSEDPDGPTDNYHFLDSFCTLNESPTGNSGTESFGGVEVVADTTTYCTFVNARDTGSVKVNKLADTNGDGSYETLNPQDFTWSLDGSGTNAMGTTLSNVVTGSHDINEDGPSDYEFVGWFLGHPEDNQYSCNELPENSTTSLPISIEVTEGSTTQVNLCNFRNIPEISIDKSNDKSGGASAGDTVTYTLVVTNTGKISLSNVDITDIIPGGFTYVFNSTTVNGVPFSDLGLTISGATLAWDNVGNLSPDESLTLVYRATIGSDLTEGTYTNYATCRAEVGGQRIAVLEIDCNTDSSDVTIGRGTNFGGRLGQVLGISTELPATGSPTGLALIALGLIGVGFILKKKYVKN